MELLELMHQRHSVRTYTGAPIEPEKREALQKLAEELNRKSGLHIQLFFDEPRCFRTFLARYGIFRGVNDYIAVVGPRTDRLEEKAGYYGEQLVLKAQELGLNTCWAALTHGKSRSVLRDGEKEVIVIALGYGTTQGQPHKNRKLSEACDLPEDVPEWFRTGMEAVLTAPTAVNQQKFRFSLEGEEPVVKMGRGSCIRIDLGIVRYHFEAVTGRRVRELK